METDSLNFWSDEAMEEGIAVAEGVIGVAINSDERISCEIEFFTRAPQYDTAKWNLVGVVEMKIGSGVLQVLNCPDDHVEYSIEIPKGNYNVRILIPNKSGESPENEDHYRIEFWQL